MRFSSTGALFKKILVNTVESLKSGIIRTLPSLNFKSNQKYYFSNKKKKKISLLKQNMTFLY